MNLDPERHSAPCHVPISEENAVLISRREMIKTLGAATAAAALAAGFGENVAHASPKYPVLICPVPISFVEGSSSSTGPWSRETISISQSATLYCRALPGEPTYPEQSEWIEYDGPGVVDTANSSDYADFASNAQFSDVFTVKFTGTAPSSDPVIVRFFSGDVGHELNVTVT